MTTSKKARILHRAAPFVNAVHIPISCLDTSYDKIIECPGKLAEI